MLCQCVLGVGAHTQHSGRQADALPDFDYEASPSTAARSLNPDLKSASRPLTMSQETSRSPNQHDIIFADPRRHLFERARSFRASFPLEPGTERARSIGVQGLPLAPSELENRN